MNVTAEATYYITIRHCNRNTLFYERRDYQCCLSQLERCLCRYGLSLHAFCLLADHLLLLLTSADKRLIVNALNELEQYYGEYFNLYLRRINRLLTLDFALQPIDADRHLLLYSRYIELAAVRTGLVMHPADYPWSSYGCNAFGEDMGLLTPHRQYLLLGEDEQSRRSDYRRLFDRDGPPDRLLHRAVA